MTMTETRRIRWEPVECGVDGYVGAVIPPVFTIYCAELSYADWMLTSELPGDARPGNDLDVLKARAEDWLARFVSSLGAVFEPEPVKSRAWHVDWAVVDRDQDGNAILRHKPTGGRYKILPVEEC